MKKCIFCGREAINPAEELLGTGSNGEYVCKKCCDRNIEKCNQR